MLIVFYFNVWALLTAALNIVVTSILLSPESLQKVNFILINGKILSYCHCEEKRQSNLVAMHIHHVIARNEAIANYA
jgi:hypothetical protein